ncbi:precorrin-2 C(20)-methyltransferase [Neokomagataea anthophila]|uniref:Precorrin-2 C(20)-methyltransferase n=1 Tax=Neokomagataea anthophila TaxID=2826925 RepID=A0ABS5E929_9PROT|nr:precorrin-2 C(20)-methyltransferase [Neokomagataea anthophila]MBR0560409.1 precorrin-2 C(20)-methyltransferase [Neokomagataea anthophila]
MSAMLRIVGVGPGDPELLTLKAARYIREASVIAYFCRHDRMGHARRIADGQIVPGTDELRFAYPFTTERSVCEASYHEEMARFYDHCAEQVRAEVSAGRNVVLLCEGDPFLYGSAMYVFDRLAEDVRCDIVPGIMAMNGCWSMAHAPICHGDDVLCVLPATMPEEALQEWLQRSDAAVVMKLGRNLPKLKRALAQAGRLDNALYVERGTQESGRVLKLAEMAEDAPYFSLALLPGRKGVR